MEDRELNEPLLPTKPRVLGKFDHLMNFCKGKDGIIYFQWIFVVPLTVVCAVLYILSP